MKPTRSRRIAIPSHWCRVIAQSPSGAMFFRERTVRQHGVNAFRVRLDETEQDSPGRIGAGAALLPVLDGIEFEAEADREFRLRQAETLANPFQVGLGRRDWQRA